MHTQRKRVPGVVAVLMAVGIIGAALPAAVVMAQPAPEAAAACAQSTAPGVMQAWERSGGNKQKVDQLVCAWNTANPHRQINLTYITHDQMVPKIAQAIASGDVPDLMGMDLIYAPQFAAAGQLEDITDLIGADSGVATASPGHIQVATWDNRLYGVPLYADVSVLFWNKALFRQAGLDPERGPTNLAEIREMSHAITSSVPGAYGFYLPGNCAGCNIFTFGPYIWSTGGTIEPAQCGDFPLVGENLTPVLQWARTMHREGQIDPAAQSENGSTFAQVLGSGKVGMMGSGNFNPILAKQQNPTIELGVTLLPGLQTGQVASFAGGDIVAIPKGSKRVADAVDFERFILSPDIQIEVYAKNGDLTTRSDMFDNEYTRADPFMPTFGQALAVSRTPFTLKFFELINSPQGPWLQMLQRVYYTNDDIEQILGEARQEMIRIACS